MIKCPKCGVETLVVKSDVNGNMVCVECWLRQRKELSLPTQKESTTAEKLLWLWNNVFFERQSLPLGAIFRTKNKTEADLHLYDDDFINSRALIDTAYLWAKEQEK